MPINIELVKKANDAEKAYGRFKAAMRRYGLTEKAMHEGGFDRDKMNPVCAALYDSWQECETILTAEASNPSQMPLAGLDGAPGSGQTEAPGTNRRRGSRQSPEAQEE